MHLPDPSIFAQTIVPNILEKLNSINYPLFAQVSSGNGLSNLLTSPMIPMLIFMIFMIYLMYRSQQKEKKRREELLKSIKTGDKVVTTGGIHGVISNVKENTFILKIADNVKIEINKANIAGFANEKTKGE